ncbi:epoxide hydrolase family protein [Microbacterium sp. NC79]|uniref:epoxide hydrolase family protein n=1 Tax=Microbacterium sp. NC79 TaxID=2851009 RepID=UPI001C2C94B1|nr:epoxide hydrolase family protein [Microbacterium sp. NC79]MBV0895553.1 epoxide hydrolase [Microbacterium sp. NC79]
MFQVHPFRIDVSDHAITELKDRLDSTRLPHDFNNDDGTYGLEARWLADMLRYWREDFDWRSVEARMNAVPQFLATIDDTPIHFQHVKGLGKRVVPIILCHGWPWTFWDWKGVIGPLSDPLAYGLPDDIAFDVVVPSLPGFAYSSPIDRGIGCRETARLFNTLMTTLLGYETYVAAGGDWGGKVAGELALMHPASVLASYTTLQAVPGHTAPLDTEGRFSDDERWMAERLAEALPTMTSHLEVHRRDPQTLAYALNDSPAGLAAWIWERRRAWRDPATLTDIDADREFLCTTASLFWFTQTIGTSMRFYSENFGDKLPAMPEKSQPPRMGFGILPKDILFLPRAEADAAADVVHWSRLAEGGHFSAYEVPDLLAADIREFVVGLDC